MVVNGLILKAIGINQKNNLFAIRSQITRLNVICKIEWIDNNKMDKSYAIKAFLLWIEWSKSLTNPTNSKNIY